MIMRYREIGLKPQSAHCPYCMAVGLVLTYGVIVWWPNEVCSEIRLFNDKWHHALHTYTVVLDVLIDLMTGDFEVH